MILYYITFYLFCYFILYKRIIKDFSSKHKVSLFANAQREDFQGQHNIMIINEINLSNNLDIQLLICDVVSAFTYYYSMRSINLRKLRFTVILI